MGAVDIVAFGPGVFTWNVEVSIQHAARVASCDLLMWAAQRG